MDPTAVHRSRWRILAVLCLSLIVIGMDNLILNLALPRVQHDLGATGGELQWIIDSYTLAFGGLLLLGGGLGDRFGRKRLLLAGLVLVLGFTLGAAYAGSPGTLIAMRAGMGVGGAFVMPATLSVIKHVFPAEEQARAISVWAGSGAIGVPLGPVLGGLLLEHFWWGSVFLISVPVVVFAIVACVVMVPESRNPHRVPLDLAGVVLSVAGLGVLVYGIIEGPHHGWTDPVTLTALAAGALFLALFVLRERWARHPMLPGKMFRAPLFAGSAVAMFCVNFCLFGLLFVVTQYLQFVRGHGPLDAGLRLLPMLTAVIGAGLGERLVRTAGIRAVASGGLAVLAGSMLLMARADAGSEPVALGALALFGFTMGLVLPPCANAILAAAPAEQGGAASAVTDATLQVGGSLGIAVIGSVLTTSYRDELPGPDGLPAPAAEAARDSLGGASEAAARLGGEAGEELRGLATDAFTQALTDAMTVAGGIAGAGVLAVLLLMPGRRRRPAPKTPATTPIPTHRPERNPVA
ncbi:MFS transporter [Streptomyces pactum]|uniref:MFS transporter n=1 Tax=Streptomyces pactum TaxID=68249 RepID=A0ABS0NT57_9ACTN|nr:MFS transporter [Streptomyces pactum]MBH5338398.1 MFS transporter [Streptomyces pactum]